MADSSTQGVPLVVDLDGTLVLTDTYEVMRAALRERSLVWALRMWAVRRRGKARLKVFLWRHAGLEVASLPINAPFLEWLREQHAGGRRLVLATGSAIGLATAVVARVGLFDEILATEPHRNLTGPRKAQALVERFGDRRFDYAGNSSADLAVWAHARRAIVCDLPPHLLDEVRSLCEVEAEFRSTDLTG